MVDGRRSELSAGEPLDHAGLVARATALRAQFQQAPPWSHIVVDDLLVPDVALRAARAFPWPSAVGAAAARLFEARIYDGSLERRDPIFAAIFAELLGPHFTQWLEQVTGVEGLRGDELLLGAGFHQGGRGSSLPLHADHNTHPHDASLYRRLNVLIFLNEAWDERWNGALQLWDRDAIACRKRIEPIFNRCVIMEVDDTTFHGYDTLRLPRGRTRNALAMYYYAPASAPGQRAAPHPTLMPRAPHERGLSYWSHKVRRAIGRRIPKALIRPVDTRNPGP